MALLLADLAAVTRVAQVCVASKVARKLISGQYNRFVRVTIVGGGIIGCAVAHALASRGADVSIVDMRGAGKGATQASAGILAPYIEGHIDALLRLGVDSLALYDDFVARVSADAGQPIEYERSGSLHVAVADATAMELAVTARRFAHDQVAHELMPGRDALRLEPALSTRIISALLLPQHGYVRAGELTSALLAAAVRRAVRRSVGCRVVRRVVRRSVGRRVVRRCLIGQVVRRSPVSRSLRGRGVRRLILLATRCETKGRETCHEGRECQPPVHLVHHAPPC